MKLQQLIGAGFFGTVIACGLAMYPALSSAQVSAPGFNAKPMIVAPISGIEDKEVAIINVAIEPGGASPRHSHPGDCYGAILEGSVELVIEGQDPRQFSAGQAWHNPRGPVHYFRNVGDKPVRMTNLLVVDKGKPRTIVEKAGDK